MQPLLHKLGNKDEALKQALEAKEIADEDEVVSFSNSKSD